MALEVRDFCKTIHFTLPESLWTEKGGFFQSFAFEKAECADVQYRLFDRELACSAKFLDVWSSVLGKIPKLASVYGIGGFSPDNQLLLTVRPKFADRIIAGKKTVELRRKFSTRWAGHQINLYASEPIASLVGEARISCVHRNHPEIIWQRFQHYVGCTKEEFDAYVSGAEEIYAIELDDVQAYRDRLPRGQMAHLLNEELTPPQSYLTLEKNKAWAKAVSLAAYLQGSFCQRFSRLLNIDKVENPFVIPTRAQPMKGIQTEFAI
jgi:predicted transcriptional regulator